MGLLDGGLQRVALGAFGSILLNGQFRMKEEAQLRDGRGRILPAGSGPDAPGVYACKAFFDRVTDEMRANGYGNRDVQIVALQLTPQRTQIPQPVEGDEITLRGSVWRVADPIAQDPAMGSWTFRATPAD